MNTAQLDLDWTRQHVRAGDPSTSIRAAESVREVAAKQAAAILAELVVIGEPMAVEQIADRLGMEAHRVGKRMSDLERSGVIQRTKLTHLNRSGRLAFKWQAC